MMWQLPLDSTMGFSIAALALLTMVVLLWLWRAARGASKAPSTALPTARADTETLRRMIDAALMPEPNSEHADKPGLHAALTAQRILTHLRPHADPDGTGYSNTLRLTDITKDHDQRSASRLVVVSSSLGLLRTAPKAPDAPDATDSGISYLLHRDVVLVLTECLTTQAVLARPDIPTGSPFAAKRNEPSTTSEPTQPLPHAPVSTQPAVVPPIASQPVASPPVVSAPAIPANTPELDFERALLEHFATETKLQPSTIAYLNRHVGKIDVTGLKTNLDLVMRHNEIGLRRPLNGALRTIERSIEDARDRFPPSQRTTPDATTAVATFAERLSGMSVAMVLLPGAAYEMLIKKLVADLDADASATSTKPIDLKRPQKRLVLEQHRQELIDAEHSGDHWSAVKQSLITFERGLAALSLGHQPARAEPARLEAPRVDPIRAELARTEPIKVITSAES